MLEPASDEWRVERVLERVSVDEAAHEAAYQNRRTQSHDHGQANATGEQERSRGQHRQQLLTQLSREWPVQCMQPWRVI